MGFNCHWFAVAAEKMQEGYCRSIGAHAAHEGSLLASNLCVARPRGRHKSVQHDLFRFGHLRALHDLAVHDPKLCRKIQLEHFAQVPHKARGLAGHLMQHIVREAGLDRLGAWNESRAHFRLESALASAYSSHWWELLPSQPAGIFSQTSEDGILHFIFHNIGVSNKVYVEFGAEDGSQCNTRLLREEFGFQGLTM